MSLLAVGRHSTIIQNRELKAREPLASFLAAAVLWFLQWILRELPLPKERLSSPSVLNVLYSGANRSPSSITVLL